MTKELLRFDDLCELGYVNNRMTLRRRVNSGTFPAPIKLGVRTIAWRKSDVDAWVKEQIRKRDQTREVPPMKLNRKQQLEALCSAIALGIGDYQRNAALQNDYGNLDGVLHATSRMVFLKYLNDYFNGQLRKEESDNDSFAAVLEEIAIVAGVRVRGTIQHSAIDPPGAPSASHGVVDREGSG